MMNRTKLNIPIKYNNRPIKENAEKIAVPAMPFLPPYIYCNNYSMIGR